MVFLTLLHFLKLIMETTYVPLGILVLCYCIYKRYICMPQTRKVSVDSSEDRCFKCLRTDWYKETITAILIEKELRRFSEYVIKLAERMRGLE